MENLDQASKGGPNRSPNYAQIIEAITTLDQDTIRTHFDSKRMNKTRVSHKQEIDHLKIELETLRTSVNKVIEALGPDGRSSPGGTNRQGGYATDHQEKRSKSQGTDQMYGPSCCRDKFPLSPYIPALPDKIPDIFFR